MANGNDPANIPYIIAENGFYYVAYKEKVKVPEIVVSAKGVANGLSEEYNDGWDFGPDSYDPTSTASIPYTQTTGIMEAINYGSSINNCKVHIKDGIYNVSAQNYDSTNGVYYSISLPDSGSVEITGDTPPSFSSDVNVVASDGVTINFLNTAFANLSSGDTYVGLWALGDLSNANSPVGCYLTMKNIRFRINTTSPTPVVQVVNIENARNLIADSIVVDVPIEVNNLTVPSNTYGFTTISASKNECIMKHVIAYGYYVGIRFSTEHVIALSCYSINCYRSYVFGGNGTMYHPSVMINCGEQGCLYSIEFVSSFINKGQYYLILGYDIQYNTTGTFAKAQGAFETTPGTISGIITYSAITAGGISYTNFWESGSGIATNTKFIYPLGQSATPILSANPPVSATVYQNTNPYDILIYLPSYATTSGTAGSVAVAIGTSSSPSTTFTQFVSGSTSSSSPDTIQIKVPAGWYYEVTTTSVTLATATVVAD